MVKAHQASFTHDEAYSYLHYMGMSYADIITFRDPFPNNHILNTAGMKFFSSVFGDTEFVLRLPNVLSFLGYALAVNGMLARMKNKLLFLPALILMICNPFLLDFFSLARGYGLAIAMIACSMNRYLVYIESKRNFDYALAFFFAGLAFMANFGTLYYLAALLLAHNLLLLGSGVPSLKTLLKHNMVSVIGILVLVLIMFKAIRRMAGLQIDFGGETGLWDDTAMSLILNTTYYHNIPMFLFLKWLTAGSVALVLLGWLARFLLLRGRFIYRGEHAFFLFLVIFSTLGASFLHHLFLGAPFLIDRFALYIVPLFWLSFIFLLDLFSAERSRVLITLPFAVIAAVMLVHSARVLDTGSFLIWRYDQDNKSVVSRLEQEYTTKTLQVSVSWFYEPAFNYYRISRELNWLEPFDRLGPKPGDDLLYLAEADTVLVPGYREELVVQRFPRSGSVLVRAAKP